MSPPKVRYALPPEAGTTELIRMISARKGCADARSASLSTFLNPFLVLCLRAAPDGALAAAPFAGDIRARYADGMGASGDGALPAYLARQPDDAARHAILRAWFLPLSPIGPVPPAPPAATAEAFDAVRPGSLGDVPGSAVFEWHAEARAMSVPEAFAPLILAQILVGRHSLRHLELRRAGGTDAVASDAALGGLIDLVAGLDPARRMDGPFLSRGLRRGDFAGSTAYAHMMELGFDRDEMVSALGPWTLVD